MNAAVRAFVERADVSNWTGLPDLGPDELGATVPWILSRGELGDPPRPARRVWLPRGCFAGGLRCWIDDDDRMLVLEGTRPRTAGGARIDPPDLGEPAERLPATLGSLALDGGELVYPDRGLAVRINPENGILLGLLGFAPTTAEDWGRRLRPAADVARPLATGMMP